MKAYHFAAVGRLAQNFKKTVTKQFNQISCTAFESWDNLDQDKVKSYDALATFDVPDTIDLSAIKWIHSFGAGVDGIMGNPTISPNCRITRTTGYMSHRMGEYCLAQLYTYYHQLEKLQQNQSTKTWDSYSRLSLRKLKVLMFGTGAIGAGIATVLHPLVQRIDGVSRSGTSREPFSAVLELSNLSQHDLADYDVIINALPLTAETTDFFDEKMLSSFNNALFMNVGRGESVVQLDVINSLDTNHLMHAVLDVFPVEPLPVSSPMWGHPKLTITPHNAGKTDADDVQQSFEQIVKCINSGNKDHHFVDIQAGY